MPYNAHYHLRLRGTHQYRLMHLFSICILLLSISALLLVLKTPLDSALFLRGFLASLARVSAAYLVCLVLALVLGLSAASSHRTETLMLPVLDLAQSFPSFALLPILVYRFGSNSISVVSILVVAMVWPMVFAVIGGIKDEHRDQSEAAKIFGATGWRRFVYYRLPMLLPVLATSSIVSWGQAWDTVVGAEIIAGVFGAGHYLGQLGTTGNTGRLALAVLVYLALIYAINQLVWLPLLARYTRYHAE